MVQQFVLYNLSFAHLCLEQINFIDIQIAWYGKGIDISIIGPWYKIMINQRFGKNPPKGTQLHITKFFFWKFLTSSDTKNKIGGRFCYI